MSIRIDVPTAADAHLTAIALRAAAGTGPQLQTAEERKRCRELADEFSEALYVHAREVTR